MKLYQDILMDHFKNPRHYGRLSVYGFTSGHLHPSCGDAISVWGTVKHGALSEVTFEGAGCVISQASASLLLERVVGKPVEKILAMGPADMTAILGFELGPVRMHCAMLSLLALQKGIESQLHTQSTEEKINHA